MAYLRGEDVVYGIGIEDPAARGVAVAPQVWIPARVASSIKQVMKKVLIKETRGSKTASSGADIVEKHADGAIEFNLRAESIGFFLKSLLGSCVSAARGGAAGAFDHTFSLLASDPEHPSLTGALSQSGVQDYQYPLTLIGGLAVSVDVNDLVTAKAPLMAKDEVEAVTPFEPMAAMNEQLLTDVYFRHFDVTLKFAADVAGLESADAIVCVRSLAFDIQNGARIDQCISDVTPGNIVTKLLTITGKATVDFTDTDLYDKFKSNTPMAAEIKMERADSVIGASTVHPSLTITLPKVTFENNNFTRPIDDVVMQDVEFAAHHDDATGEAITVLLTNARADYEAPGS